MGDLNAVENVYCVAVTFKMSRERICIKFCLRLEYFFVETIWVIQKAFRDEAMSANQVTMWGTSASKMVKNLLKVIHSLVGLQQAEELRMLNLYGLHSTKIGE